MLHNVYSIPRIQVVKLKCQYWILSFTFISHFSHQHLKFSFTAVLAQSKETVIFLNNNIKNKINKFNNFNGHRFSDKNFPLCSKTVH